MLDPIQGALAFRTYAGHALSSGKYKPADIPAIAAVLVDGENAFVLTLADRQAKAVISNHARTLHAQFLMELRSQYSMDPDEMDQEGLMNAFGEMLAYKQLPDPFTYEVVVRHLDGPNALRTDAVADAISMLAGVTDIRRSPISCTYNYAMPVRAGSGGREDEAVPATEE